MPTNAEKFDIVQQFVAAMARKDLQAAAEFLTEDITFTTPMMTITSKQEWLEKASKPMNASFEELQMSDDGTIFRMGTKKVAMISLKVRQTFDVNDDGKIQSVTIRKA